MPKKPSVEKILPPEPPRPVAEPSPAPSELGDDEEHEDLVLEGADYAGTDARRVHLSRVRLERVGLARTAFRALVLSDARIVSCDLAGVEWERPHFRRVECEGSRWVGARLANASVHHLAARDCNFEMALFTGGRIESARFERCVLRGAVFDGAELRGVAFRGCDLREVDFRRARLHGADLRGCEITGLVLAPESLRGMVLDPEQAVQLVEQWGARVLYAD